MTPEFLRAAMFAASVLCIPDNRDDMAKHANIDRSYNSKDNNSFARRCVTDDCKEHGK